MSALTRRSWLAGTSAIFLPLQSIQAQPAPVMLANVWRSGLPLAGYWISEKYDGVRGYWDGKRLWTRGSQPVVPPLWFTAGWPTIPMDGELWAGRGRFAHAVSTVRQQMPDDAAWHGMRFMVFDLPAQPGNFDTRLAALQALVSAGQPGSLQPVSQRRIASEPELQALMRDVVRNGGEGLALHLGASPYRGIRSDDLLKLKPHEDADARVVAHVKGKGKYEGVVGALVVETPEGQRFRIGSGLRDAQRVAPPAVGTWISYRYRGLNDSGLPRFATFLRERPDLGP